MLWQLFVVFLKIGSISFGGGYAIIALIQREVTDNGWIQPQKFQELVALAGMSPGSIATNTATLIGYSQLGLAGAAAATAGIILPSLIIVILCASFFLKMQGNRWVRASFYGLRPVITGFIIYAAVHFGAGGSGKPLLTWPNLGMLIICVLCLTAVLKYKLHPFAAILLSAVCGIVIF
ncbi:chromate transporter [Paenibacillus sp. MMS20-IR301]|uniref:chromate transporter n=1 Tax=Paenibacillus sp. MMS20-IR301 TaxID=2895946 RepID=UPI0028E1DF4C|nr:chromate transporter [Paenibacillus sp. MMS20-IR301]WNS44006.1 chromate transporter [Paenibacillus sp. MMS20-IR301]